MPAGHRDFVGKSRTAAENSAQSGILEPPGPHAAITGEPAEFFRPTVKRQDPRREARVFTGKRPWDAEPAQGVILLAKNDRLSFCYVNPQHVFYDRRYDEA